MLQSQKNNKLQEKYVRNIHAQDKENIEKKKLKKRTSEIVAQSENFNLKLIDFSSSETELNLNFNGSFHSILNFIYYLEIEMDQFKIAEFKIKNSNNDLFFFLKLKNELIKNEKNIF